MIASAAHQHLVVEKINIEEKAPSTLASKRMSRIRPLDYREERKSEIARMATGNLETSAGLDLAQALLANFDDQPSASLPYKATLPSGINEIATQRDV